MIVSFLRRKLVVLVLAPLALGACTETLAPVSSGEAGAVTVDASTSYAYLVLEGSDLVPVAVGDPATSAAWDLGFLATTVTTNGGAAGPGGVEVACVCANAAASDAQVMAMTPEAELADFDAVTGTTAASLTYASDALAPAISGWFAGSGTTATVVADRSWIVREGTPTAVLAKFRVTALAGATADAMGTVTFEYAVQPAAGEAFGTVASVELAVGTTPVYFDLTTGATTEATNWDLQFVGWAIRVNSGVSGTGSVRAVLDTSTPFDDIDATYASFAPPQAYSSDAYSGTIAASPWYRYNLTGTDNQIWPTFNVYVVRRGDVAFKVQLLNYYGPAGEPRQITVRYRRLAE